MLMKSASAAIRVMLWERRTRLGNRRWPRISLPSGLVTSRSVSGMVMSTTLGRLGLFLRLRRTVLNCRVSLFPKSPALSSRICGLLRMRQNPVVSGATIPRPTFRGLTLVCSIVLFNLRRVLLNGSMTKPFSLRTWVSWLWDRPRLRLPV